MICFPEKLFQRLNVTNGRKFDNWEALNARLASAVSQTLTQPVRNMGKLNDGLLFRKFNNNITIKLIVDVDHCRYQRFPGPRHIRRNH